MVRSRAARLTLLLVLSTPVDRPARRLRAAKASRCRIRFWTYDARCRYCRIRVQEAATFRPAGRLSLTRLQPRAAVISSLSCCRVWMRWKSRFANFVDALTRRRTRCSGRAPTWPSGLTTWPSKRRTPTGARGHAGASRSPAATAARRSGTRGSVTGFGQGLHRRPSGGHRNCPCRRGMQRWVVETTQPRNRRHARC